jgi:hypothetical protein
MTLSVKKIRRKKLKEPRMVYPKKGPSKSETIHLNRKNVFLYLNPFSASLQS